MVVEAGYKQTEIGIIPSDWNLIPFDEAFNFLSTSTYSRSELVEYGDIFYVHYGDIHTKWNHFLDLSKHPLPCIDKSQLKNYSLIKEGDLIIADASEDYEGICKSVEVKNIANKKIIAGLHTFLLRSKKDNFVNGFKGYINSNQLIRNQYNRLATGLKVYGVSKTNLKVILIPQPKQEEQLKIAQVLYNTDELINSLNKLISKKKELKLGILQELLSGRRRLKGYKKEWSLRRLDELFNITAGGDINKLTFSKFKDDKHPYPIYANSIRNKGLYGFSSEYKYSDVCITVTARGTLGVANIRNEKFNAIIRLLILSPKEKLNCFFISEYINNNVAFSIESTGVPQLTAPQISTYSVAFPDPEEQKAIARVLSDMDSDIASLEEKRDKYLMFKQGMMQQLLTGRIRLKW